MSILEKLNVFNKSCCQAGTCSPSQSSGNMLKCVLCYIKKFILVAICVAILSPILVYYVLPKVMHNFIINNPEAIIESVQKFSEKKQKEMQEGAVEKVKDIYIKEKNDPSIPFIGNKNGVHVAVVYYDYSCTYCKKVADEFKQLLKKDSQLKVILKDLPLFGPSSILASKASMYVYTKHGSKFEEFHFKLLGLKEINENSIHSITKSLGINENVVKESKSLYEKELRNNYLQANEIRIDGTPAIIINNKLSLGYKQASEIEKMFQ